MRKYLPSVDVSDLSVPSFHMNAHGERTDLPRNHPRFSFSLDREIKADLSVNERIELCEALADHVADALARWPHDPITVEALGMSVRLSDHASPNKAGKVWVRY